MPALTTARRSELRAQAHGLAPVVIIGDKGLSPSVVAEIDRALKAHELVKVKAATDDREARAAWMAQLCEALQAQPVQSIGKILVLWRENPDKAKKKEANAKPAPKTDPRKKPKASSRQKKHRTAEELIRTERLRSRALSPRPASEPRRRRPRTSQ
jgi:putative YhbY family RNA-binding protein